MAELAGARSCRPPGGEERGGGEGGGPERRSGGGLSDAQLAVLERCLHALKHAENDSHTLAALLLITRLCPASQLDQSTLRRLFQAVGLNLPARLLMTAVRGSDGSTLPPDELLSLGTALLAALSTDPDMASHPQLLSTVPLLLGVLAQGPQNQDREDQENQQDWENQQDQENGLDQQDRAGRTPEKTAAGPLPETRSEATRTSPEPSSWLDEAVAADCYQVLTAVCGLPRGPDQLLSRAAVPALCRAVEQNQTLSRDRGLALLGRLLSGRTRTRAWSRHPAELLALLGRLSKDFCRSSDQNRLGLCSQLVQFLPPAGLAVQSEDLKGAVRRVWAGLRPLVQAKLTARQMGPVLVLSACLLDLQGWELVGPPKFCCLLVNRACVEVRMGLEEPPGKDLSPELQQTLTGCYRIMEASMEEACLQKSVSGLSVQQSRQVLGVLEESVSAAVFYLQQVDPGRYGDPFVFATFRCLCSWLAEETSCLREEVTRLLPFLVGYSRKHLQEDGPDQNLQDWTGDEGDGWTGSQALRYLLPALCHLSAEEGPRKVLLGLEAPALLVDFLSRCWTSMKGDGPTRMDRDPSMETACSALLNFTVTEPDRVRKDSSFRTLEAHLTEALPVLVNKPRLLVLAANYCTLGLMIGRLKSPSGLVEASQQRFLSAALRFLSGALRSRSSSGSGPVEEEEQVEVEEEEEVQVEVSPGWEQSWEEVVELWRLSLQALGGLVLLQPSVCCLLLDQGWLRNTLRLLESGSLQDLHSLEVLEELLRTTALQSPVCRQEIRDVMRSSRGALSRMKKLKEVLGLK